MNGTLVDTVVVKMTEDQWLVYVNGKEVLNQKPGDITMLDFTNVVMPLLRHVNFQESFLDNQGDGYIDSWLAGKHEHIIIEKSYPATFHCPNCGSEAFAVQCQERTTQIYDTYARQWLPHQHEDTEIIKVEMVTCTECGNELPADVAKQWLSPPTEPPCPACGHRSVPCARDIMAKEDEAQSR